MERLTMGQELCTYQFENNLNAREFRSSVGPQSCDLKPITYRKVLTLIATLTDFIDVLRRG